jgi:hypothetical protein
MPQVLHHYVFIFLVLCVFYFEIAWTDFERVPRSSWCDTTTVLNEHDHGGSRKRLMLTRRERLRLETQEKLSRVIDSRPKSCNPALRINLISDYRVENS